MARASLRAVLYLVLLLMALVPFAADILLVRMRHIRFTFDFLYIYIRDSKLASSLPVSKWETDLGALTAGTTVLMVLAVWVVSIVCLNLARWNPMGHLVARWSKSQTTRQEAVQIQIQTPPGLEEGRKAVDASTQDANAAVMNSPSATNVAAPYEFHASRDVAPAQVFRGFASRWCWRWSPRCCSWLQRVP